MTTVSIVTETATKVVGCMTQNTVTGGWCTLMVVFMRFVGSFLVFFIAFPCRDSGGLIVTMETGHSFMHQGLSMRDCGLMATLKVCHFSLSLSLSLTIIFLCHSFFLSFSLVETTRLILEGKNPTHIHYEQGKTFDVALKCIDDSGGIITIG